MALNPEPYFLNAKMRGSAIIGRRVPYPSHATKQTLIPFSTSSGGDGRGRGSGRGRGFPRIDFAAPRAPGQPQPEPDDSKPGSADWPSPSGHGRGRSKPVTSSPILPSFSSFVSSIKSPSAAGRGGPSSRVPGQPGAEQRPPEHVQESEPKRPLFFKKEDGTEAVPPEARDDVFRRASERDLPEGIASALIHAGRGQPRKQPGPEIQSQEVNRHLRARQSPSPSQRPGPGPGPAAERETGPKISVEEAVKHAMGVLSRVAEDVEVGAGGRGRGMRGRGGRGWGRGRGRGKGRGRGEFQDSDDLLESALYLGDNADGEKLAMKIGTEMTSKLTEAFDEVGDWVLPSPFDDAYLDAMDVNYKIEFEPEYLMGDFESNPDIDEKPPIPLRDALEKAKPFLMAYEGIESQEEWEEIMKETMERVPLLKEIVDYYSGPDRVTAKKQQEELERVAKTLPESAPDSVKQFTERAVLSLQSNPGWGFDKKCQFMDKLVAQMSQQYK